MKKIKWCVIGAGGIADRRGIPGLLSDPNNEILAVMDLAVHCMELFGSVTGDKIGD